MPVTTSAGAGQLVTPSTARLAGDLNHFVGVSQLPCMTPAPSRCSAITAPRHPAQGGREGLPAGDLGRTGTGRGERVRSAAQSSLDAVAAMGAGGR